MLLPTQIKGKEEKVWKLEKRKIDRGIGGVQEEQTKRKKRLFR